MMHAICNVDIVQSAVYYRGDVKRAAALAAAMRRQNIERSMLAAEPESQMTKT